MSLNIILRVKIVLIFFSTKRQQQTLVKNPDRLIEPAVKTNTKFYGDILTNRITKETAGFEAKIEQELSKQKYKNLSELETKQKVYQELKGLGTARPKNIIRDALHTNQCNMSFIKALNEGWKYKIWMNGRIIGVSSKKGKRGRTRPWHVAKLIAPVKMDEMFEIGSPCNASVMYPGDPAGGACNVANCRCWLTYSNTRPNGYKKKGTYDINYHNVFNKKNTNSNKVNAKKTNKKSLKSKVTSTFTNIKNKLSSSINNLKNNLFLDSGYSIKLGEKELIITEEQIKNRKENFKKIINKEYNPSKIFEEFCKFEKDHALKDVEYLRMYNLKGKPVLKNRTDNKKGSVSIPKQIIAENKNGFLHSIHNHTSGNPTPSVFDFEKSIIYNIKYSEITGGKRGYYIIKCNHYEKVMSKDTENILKTIKKKYKELYKEYDDYVYTCKKWKRYKKITAREYEDLINRKLDEEFSKNNEEMYNYINNEFKKHNIDITVFYGE